MSVIVNAIGQFYISREVLLVLAEKLGQLICSMFEKSVKAFRAVLSCQAHRFVAKSEECEAKTFRDTLEIRESYGENGVLPAVSGVLSADMSVNVGVVSG